VHCELIFPAPPELVVKHTADQYFGDVCLQKISVRETPAVYAQAIKSIALKDSDYHPLAKGEPGAKLVYENELFKLFEQNSKSFLAIPQQANLLGLHSLRDLSGDDLTLLLNI
jgi:hypothetical protein